ncbi:MAG: NAD(P)-dependent oxidoreductase, partial [Candidatus Nanoarchaeia archaeon]|nr:NAD(P)-dependent oxidoreductase [Candidatus Nanoarchaeia archaeon]
MANIIITGGSGFIGQQVIRTATEKGHKVGVIDFKNPGFDVEFEKANIAAYESVLMAFKGLDRKLEKIDAVVHLAASFNYSKPDHYQYMVNVEGTRNVAEAATAAGISRFINMGAVAEYREGSECLIKESTPLQPCENYGKTKHMAEEMLFEEYSRELEIITFRAAMVYGNFSTGSYIDGMFNMVKNSPLIVTPMKNTRNSYVHTDDIARAILHAVENPSRVFKAEAKDINDLAYNLADENPVSEREVVAVLKTLIPGAANKPLLPVVPETMFKAMAALAEFFEGFVSDKPSLPKAVAMHAPFNHALDNSKFKATGFEYSVKSISEGMPRVVE